MISLPIELYSDGSSEHNPGPSGFAYIIRYYEDKEDSAPIPHEIEFSQGFRLSTNNRMELMGGIYGLKKIIELIDDGTLIDARQIQLGSDSEYFCKAINQGWIAKWQANDWMTSGYANKKPQPVKNKDLWEQIVEIQETLKQKNVNLVMTYIPGHTGHEYNERCDKLAVGAAAGNDLIRDEIYESTANNYTRN